MHTDRDCEELIMDGQATFLDCPEYVGADRTARCGLPAEVEAWYTLRSTDGPLQGAKIRCPQGHWFNGPVDSLTVNAGEPAALPVTVLMSGPSRERRAAVR
jgi:hypothetical protein